MANLNVNEDLEQQLFEERLKEQLHQHRKKLNLVQAEVADLLCKSVDTYQRWESTGKCLTYIFDILRVFQELKFSTAEIIDVLGLPHLTLNEVKSIYQDEDIVKSIKGNGIYSAMREKCPDIDDCTLEMLLVLLLKERLKRLESRHGNSYRTI